jgi:hypothetical protein
MNALLRLHTHRESEDLLLPCAGHIVFTTVAGQGWLAGPKPPLDALWGLTSAYPLIKGQHGVLSEEVRGDKDGRIVV